MRAERLMEELGVFVHGALSFGHALGLIFNWRKKNWLDVTAHGLAMSYDLWAVKKHLGRLEEKHDDRRRF